METSEVECDMKGNGICPLPLENMLDIIRKKWSLSLIIAIGNFGKLHFNAIHDKIKDRHTKKITQKILSARLKELENFELVRRERYTNYPFMVEYSLTKKGRNFYEILLTFGRFNEKKK